MIVNTASKDLNLSQGVVSANISKTGGDSIQKEHLSKYPEGVNFGEIVVTGAGNLACKIVCDGALPQWDNGTGDSKIASIFVVDKGGVGLLHIVTYLLSRLTVKYFFSSSHNCYLTV